jgi:cell division protein ZapA
MKSIKVTIFGRQYPLKIEEHEEQLMYSISRYVDEKFNIYKNQLSKQPESTIMTLAALSLAEELFEERRKNREMDGSGEKLLERVNFSLEKFIEEI